MGNLTTVSYPKFKLDKEVVREVAVPPAYGKFYVVNDKTGKSSEKVGKVVIILFELLYGIYIYI